MLYFDVRSVRFRTLSIQNTSFVYLEQNWKQMEEKSYGLNSCWDSYEAGSPMIIDKHYLKIGSATLNCIQHMLYALSVPWNCTICAAFHKSVPLHEYFHMFTSHFNQYSGSLFFFFFNDDILEACWDQLQLQEGRNHKLKSLVLWIKLYI